MPKITVQVSGKKTSFTDKEFKAKGGEASIYVKGDTSFKIWHDPVKVIDSGKVQDLSALTMPNIIKPETAIYDESGHKKIGYTMRFVKNAYALCELFTKAFQQRHKLDHTTLLKLTKRFHETIEHIHSKKILVVDLNELNFLIADTFDELYAIDVNSYETPNYRATAIMDNIRDRHMKNVFTPETDWFSWAVVTFQLLVGIHPYRGKHPKFESIAPINRMDARMKANVSAFNADSTMPRVCHPLDVIPPALRQWMVAVFEKGIREVPPANFETLAIAIATHVKEITGSDLFDIKDIAEYADEIIAHYFHDGTRVVVTTNNIHVNGFKITLRHPNVKIGFTSTHKPIAAYAKDGKAILQNLADGSEIPFICDADYVMESDGRIYFQNGISVIEIVFNELGNKVTASAKRVGRVLDLPDATRVFDGVIVQNLLGRWFASVFPEAGQQRQFPVDELKDYKIIDAKYKKNVLVIIGINHIGKYDRFVLRFDSSFKYDLRKIEDVVNTGINFTVNSNGVCTLINEEDHIEAFAAKHGSPSVKIFKDSAIDGAMKLSCEDAKIVFANGNQLQSISMKK